LKAGYLEQGERQPTLAGTPQGGVISPLLANVALHGLQEAIGPGALMVRYADDFVIFCRSKAQAAFLKKTVSAWLAERGLELHPIPCHALTDHEMALVDEAASLRALLGLALPKVWQVQGLVLSIQALSGLS
jgi:hypothetical protein